MPLEVESKPTKYDGVGVPIVPLVLHPHPYTHIHVYIQMCKYAPD